MLKIIYTDLNKDILIWNIGIEVHKVHLHLISYLIQFGWDLINKLLVLQDMLYQIHNEVSWILIGFLKQLLSNINVLSPNGFTC